MTQAAADGIYTLSMQFVRLVSRGLRTKRAAGALVSMLVVLGVAVSLIARHLPPAHVAQGGRAGCRLGPIGAGGSGSAAVRHVIFIQFDNVHFVRQPGYANVPSDLEQMPNLLNFIEQNGVLDNNHHTPLLSHTANDILTAETGSYADQVGQPVANSYLYYQPDGSVGGSPSSFSYWTADSPDGTPNLLTADGRNAPAPWAPFTRAGCNVGAVSIADLEVEDYKSDQPALALPLEPFGTAAERAQTNADFLGIAVHCAQGAALCSTARGGLPDSLRDEPGGYDGFQALFGHKFVAPEINPDPGGGPHLSDLDAKPIQALDPSTGCAAYTGFPGFSSISASQSLAYVADMQEHDVPVTFAYIADAHDNHACLPTGSPSLPAYGPGEAGYVAQLKAYDTAFGRFFARLKSDGIDQTNTLFMFSADEGDHFLGGQPANPDCDGVKTPCRYAHVNGCAPIAVRQCPPSNVGEFAANNTGLLAGQQGITTPTRLHADSAPAYYLYGNPPQLDNAVTRPFERGVARLTATNPLSGQTDALTTALADQAALKLLHMITGDAARTPTFVDFEDPNYFSANSPRCSDPPFADAPCVDQETAFAWNHGDIQPDIVVTWLGLIGPGVRVHGVVGDVWSDHADIRPTMLALLGLKDDYGHEGRPLREFFDDSVEPSAVRAQAETLNRLGAALKQIDAPVGELGLAGLQISTAALESGDTTDDSLYRTLAAVLACITAQRDALAGPILQAIEGAEFAGQTLDQQQAVALITQAQDLVQLVEAGAAAPQSAACPYAAQPRPTTSDKPPAIQPTPAAPRERGGPNRRYTG